MVPPPIALLCIIVKLSLNVASSLRKIERQAWVKANNNSERLHAGASLASSTNDHLVYQNRIQILMFRKINKIKMLAPPCEETSTFLQNDLFGKAGSLEHVLSVYVLIKAK